MAVINAALPRSSHNLQRQHLDGCRNLGLMLDKYAPWAVASQGNGWKADLEMTVLERRQGQTQPIQVRGGQAKGVWLSTTRAAKQGETPSLFEQERTDVALMRAHQARWLASVVAAGGSAFEMQTAERLVVGLGAGHVLETAITLERNTGLPYIPGSSLKGLARTQALFEFASQLRMRLENEQDAAELNTLDELLRSGGDNLRGQIEQLIQRAFTDDDSVLCDWIVFVFGTQERAGEVVFVDAIYGGHDAPSYATDTMTPHYVQYYTTAGQQPPAEDDNPNPVAFLTVDRGNPFHFGLLPRSAHAVQVNAPGVAADWLKKALVSLGAGGKTAAGYGFFRRKSERSLT